MHLFSFSFFCLLVLHCCLFVHFFVVYCCSFHSHYSHDSYYSHSSSYDDDQPPIISIQEVVHTSWDRDADPPGTLIRKGLGPTSSLLRVARPEMGG